MAKRPLNVLKAVAFWTWIDEQQELLHRKADAARDVASDSYKLFLMGKHEMLDAVADYLYEYELTIEVDVKDDDAE